MRRYYRLSLIIYGLQVAAAFAGPWRQALDPSSPPVPAGAFDTAAFDGAGAFANAARTDSRYLLAFEAPERPGERWTVYEVSLRVRVGASNAVWVALGEGEPIRIGNEQGSWQVVTGDDARPMSLDWAPFDPWPWSPWWAPPPATAERSIRLRFGVAPDGAIAYVTRGQPLAYLSPPPSLKATRLDAQGLGTATLSLRGQGSALVSLETRWVDVGTTIIVR